MNERTRLIFALVLAVFGVGAALWMFARNREAPIGKAAIQPVGDLAREIACLPTDFQCDRAGMPVLLGTARELAEVAIRRLGDNLPDAEGAAAAFADRLHMTLDGDFDKQTMLLRMWGFNTDDAEEFRKGWTAVADMYRFAPIGPDRLESQLIYHRGRPVALDEVKQGLSRTENRLLTAFLPADPVQDRLTIIEVRLPIKAVSAPDGTKRLTALIGYRFVWIAERKQWIPWSTVIVRAPGAEAVFVPGL